MNKIVKDSSWLLGSFVILVAWRYISDIFGETPVESIRLTSQDVFYLGSMVLVGLYIGAYPKLRIYLLRLLLGCTILVIAAAYIELKNHASIVSVLGFHFGGAGAVHLDTVTAVQMRGEKQRVESVFSHSIIFGQFLDMMLPILLYVIIKDRNISLKIIAGTVIPALCIAIVATGSRAALVGAGAALLVFAALLLAKRINVGFIFSLVAFATISGIVVKPLIGDLIGGRGHDEATSTSSRTKQYERGFVAIIDEPLTGYGGGRSPTKAGTNEVIKGHLFQSIDTYYLSVILDTGWIGALILIWCWGGLTWKATSAAVVSKDTTLGAALAASLIAFELNMSIVTIDDNLTILYLYIGMVFGIFRTANYELKRPGRPSVHRAASPERTTSLP